MQRLLSRGMFRVMVGIVAGAALLTIALTAMTSDRVGGNNLVEANLRAEQARTQLIEARDLCVAQGREGYRSTGSLPPQQNTSTPCAGEAGATG